MVQGISEGGIPDAESLLGVCWVVAASREVPLGAGRGAAQ